MTSGGKLRGISRALSHNALSLVHIHDEGQRGGLALLLSTARRTDATTSAQSQGDLLGIVRVFLILANRCGHDLRVEELPPHEPGAPLWFLFHAAVWRPRDAPSAPVSLRRVPCAATASRSGGDETARPQRCNYTTPPDKRRIYIPCDPKKLYNIIKFAL